MTSQGNWYVADLIKSSVSVPGEGRGIRARESVENGAGVSIGTEGFGGVPGGAVTAEEQMVTRVGLEPTTPGLKGRYSAN